MNLIDSPEELKSLCVRLREEPEIAIDTEFVRERSYRPRLELVQIATRDGETAIVDYGTLGRLEPDPFAEVLAAPSVLKVFHASDQDLEMLERQTGVVPSPVWDTQLVLGLFGYNGRSGYSAVVEALLGARPKSGESLTDWTRRPLAREQLEYACEDVRYLLPLLDAERTRLERLGRLGWAEQECRDLVERARVHAVRRGDDETWHLRIRGWQKLRPKGLAILRELAAWREQEAERRNRPAGTVVRDDLLVEIARRAPTSTAELRRLRGFPPNLLDRHGEGLIAAVEAGKRVPHAELPNPAPPGVDLGETERALVWLLQAVLQVTALEKEVSTSLVTNSAEVQRLVTAVSRGEPLEGLRLLHGWRREIVGDELLAVLDGRRHVSWDPASRRLRLEDR